MGGDGVSTSSDKASFPERRTGLDGEVSTITEQLVAHFENA
jgi:hypothetical protein